MLSVVDTNTLYYLPFSMIVTVKLFGPMKVSSEFDGMNWRMNARSTLYTISMSIDSGVHSTALSCPCVNVR